MYTAIRWVGDFEKGERMSDQYNAYLRKHRNGVKAAYMFMAQHDMVPDGSDLRIRVYCHDLSKERSDEYLAYDAYFYGESLESMTTPDLDSWFDEAWLKHIHRNDHHWQYWILHKDDGGYYPLRMDQDAIYEMVCDWWSFSLNKKEPYAIFDWYMENQHNMELHKDTRKILEDILCVLKQCMDMMREEDWEDFYSIAGIE